MRVTSITASRSVRVNTGNYEGTEHFVSMTAELDELDDELVETRLLAKRVETALLKQLQYSYSVRGKKEMIPKRIAKHHGLGLANLI